MMLFKQRRQHPGEGSVVVRDLFPRLRERDDAHVQGCGAGVTAEGRAMGRPSEGSFHLEVYVWAWDSHGHSDDPFPPIEAPFFVFDA